MLELIARASQADLANVNTLAQSLLFTSGPSSSLPGSLSYSVAGETNRTMNTMLLYVVFIWYYRLKYRTKYLD